MTARRLTARQLTKALSEIDAQLDGLQTVLSTFQDIFGGGEVPEAVGDAWNATHDAIAALESRRAEVELNPRPIPAAEMGTWALVQQNID